MAITDPVLIQAYRDSIAHALLIVNNPNAYTEDVIEQLSLLQRLYGDLGELDQHPEVYIPLGQYIPAGKSIPSDFGSLLHKVFPVSQTREESLTRMEPTGEVTRLREIQSIDYFGNVRTITIPFDAQTTSVVINGSRIDLPLEQASALLKLGIASNPVDTSITALTETTRISRDPSVGISGTAGQPSTAPSPSQFAPLEAGADAFKNFLLYGAIAAGAFALGTFLFNEFKGSKQKVI